VWINGGRTDVVSVMAVYYDLCGVCPQQNAQTRSDEAQMI